MAHSNEDTDDMNSESQLDDEEDEDYIQYDDEDYDFDYLASDYADHHKSPQVLGNSLL